VIGATIALMRRSGFSGAGIHEILEKSGARKGSLYHFFPEGKRQIVIEALRTPIGYWFCTTKPCLRQWTPARRSRGFSVSPHNDWNWLTLPLKTVSLAE